MRYDVPFSSQYVDIGDHEWRARGCGITALKMVFDYWHAIDARQRTDTLDTLLAYGRAHDAHLDGIGWTHRGLSMIATTYGYDSEPHDFADKSPSPLPVNEAWRRLEESLAKGPIIASVWSGFDPRRGTGHLIVITGIEHELVVLNDPEERTPEEGQRHIAASVFRDAWKRRYITVSPRKLPREGLREESSDDE